MTSVVYPVVCSQGSISSCTVDKPEVLIKINESEIKTKMHEFGKKTFMKMG